MIRCLLLTLFCFPVLSPAAEEKPAEKGVSIRLFAVTLHAGQGKVCLASGKTRGEEFEIPTHNLSDPLPVAAREIQLIDPSSAVDPPPRPLSTIKLPEAGRDFRVILIPTAESAYRSVVVRGDDPKFGIGDVFFINLSTHHMLGMIGTAKLDLKSGALEIVHPSGATPGNFFPVRFARREQERLLPMTDTRWPVLRNNRSFLVFYNGKQGLPTYRAVDEFLDPDRAAR